jgi:hypothetical protein
MSKKYDEVREITNDTIWRIRFAFRISKATRVHAHNQAPGGARTHKYVILITFPRRTRLIYCCDVITVWDWQLHTSSYIAVTSSQFETDSYTHRVILLWRYHSFRLTATQIELYFCDVITVWDWQLHTSSYIAVTSSQFETDSYTHRVILLWRHHSLRLTATQIELYFCGVITVWDWQLHTSSYIAVTSSQWDWQLHTSSYIAVTSSQFETDSYTHLVILLWRHHSEIDSYTHLVILLWRHHSEIDSYTHLVILLWRHHSETDSYTHVVILLCTSWHWPTGAVLQLNCNVQ